ncbi:putative ER-derived vesicles protein [Clavispora lusitaniae]|uniref:Endoplasmic reticulum-Golgi intermediate compartment protein n=3 Tax=Clavispora lusitaniae TaxID=36911 RepID=C4XXN9_CLAL4|nr:uncharacterized protein CLUG_00711 [Clavispora lusitaniae ATCC 42720]OVF06875.1 putative ER-derived vesicles protein [Clavispora lusitaniae]EEQ36588.1 hypothetical protein CLUG_00711 [Clavispora lusitaniae ATCC 42720]QFZ25623.1 putative ER-derived vesicles protein [Clavispora lusitaniae]QFZ31074.1 putative ER-derived vesicles protein [Clavispora lusitaniae]QFZ36742.1 putative ER-derived vesicles protein [Clavispora lusitaniae]
MDNFSSKVRVFDAFPKVAPEASVRSQRGGFSTILTVFCGLLIIWIQIGGYLGGYIDRQFSVDNETRKDLNINLDMVVAMPCQFISTNVMDITSDRYLAGEVLNFQGTGFYVPEFFALNRENNDYDTPELDEIMQETLRAEYGIAGARVNEDAPACHIFGTIPVNHVRGEFFIVPKGSMYRDRSSIDPKAYNFSHVISEFSFGDFYPFITNPLDFTAKVTEENRQAYRYFAKLVPTHYEKLGLVVDTYQYSLTEIHNVDHNRGIPPPGIFFDYSFEPIKLTIREKRIGFFAFVARLMTVLSGLLIAAGYLFRLYEKLLALLYGKKYVERDTEKRSGGLLDKSFTEKNI